MARIVTKINAELQGRIRVFQRQNMGTFKAVGYPEDVGRFYRLEEYEAYCWTAHLAAIPPIPPAGGAARTLLPCWTGPSSTTERYPPTTPTAAAWKCSAINARCKRIRRSWPTSRTTCCGGRGLTLEETASVMAAPFWSTIERMEPQEAERLTYLRKVFPQPALTGPFSIILGFSTAD